MAKIDLSKYGITGTTEIVYNPSYEMLFEEETKPTLEGFEKGQESELGAVNVMTGIYTGRSPKDKFIVKDENSKDTVWWTTDEYKNDNHPATQEAWDAVKALAIKELSNKRLFVVDAFCGANKDTRMAIRFIVEFKHYTARFNYCYPVFWRTFTSTHTSFSWFSCYRLMREYFYPNFPASFY